VLCLLTLRFDSLFMSQPGEGLQVKAAVASQGLLIFQQALVCPTFNGRFANTQ
jgi:hypothetical protein